jgi:hypothetical protein
MSAGKLEVAWDQAATCWDVRKAGIEEFESIPKGATFGSCPGSETSLTCSGCREHIIGRPNQIWPCSSISSMIVDQVGFFRRFEALPMT